MVYDAAVSLKTVEPHVNPFTRQWTWILLAAAIASLVVKGLLAWNTLGTNDMLQWQFSAEKARHVDAIRLYSEEVQQSYLGQSRPPTVFNHPPFIVYLLRLILQLSESLRIPFRTMFRLVISVADFGCFVLTWLLIKHYWKSGKRRNPREARLPLLMLALCPINIMVAGFHANTDPLMVLFLLAAVWSLEVRHSVLLCGCCIGMAMNIKIIPLVLLPVLLFYLKGWSERVLCLAAALITVLLPSLPCLMDDPRALIVNVLAYNSMSGLWGISAILKHLHLPGLLTFTHYGKFGVAAVLVLMAYLANRLQPKPRLFDQLGTSLLLVMFLAPGFGVQYLYWLTAWVVILGIRATLLLYVTSGTFTFILYNYWAHGLPWWFADYEDWGGWMHIPQLASWASLGILVGWFWWSFLFPSGENHAEPT